jgi:hypothetical protein
MMLRSQEARVRSLSATATSSGRQMRRAAAVGRRSLVDAATRPSSLVAAALAAGTLIWIWPRRRSELGVTDHLATAVRLGALVWHFARSGGERRGRESADAHLSREAVQ